MEEEKLEEISTQKFMVKEITQDKKRQEKISVKENEKLQEKLPKEERSDKKVDPVLNDISLTSVLTNPMIKNFEELLKNPSSSCKYSSEGLEYIRNEMVKRFREFIEGYEPILIDFLREQDQSRYQDLFQQNESLKQEKDELSLQNEKLSDELHKTKKETITFKSRAELAEIQNKTLEKKLDQVTQESSSLTKLCDELLTKLENI